MSVKTHSSEDRPDARTDDPLRSLDQPIDIESLIAEERTLPFLGVTPVDTKTESYPDDVKSTDNPFLVGEVVEPQSLKTVIKSLPEASSGDLWTTNEFIRADGEVDIDAIRRVPGLDIAELETITGTPLEHLAEAAESEPIDRVRDHQDIVDERRKALNALGFDVRYRWQIASDSYAIINPQEAYLPIIGALQRRGEDDAFGWVSYRDWGGLLKMFVVCPGLRHVVPLDVDESSDTNDELVLYGGFETGYDFRGTQTLWAKPILFFPDSGTVLPDTGERYTRRHYGRATDAAHERAHDRVPINEWWRSIYDDIDLRMVSVDQALRQVRAITYDFAELPFDAETCYTYWGVAQTYASAAAERARSIARPSTRPTVFNLQLSLLIALLEHYDGPMASDTYQEYLEVAGDLLRKPSMMIQLAMKEHDRVTDEGGELLLPDDQQTLSDTLEDIVDIPGIDVNSEVDLSDQQAQRLQDQVQRTFDELA